VLNYQLPGKYPATEGNIVKPTHVLLAISSIVTMLLAWHLAQQDPAPRTLTTPAPVSMSPFASASSVKANRHSTHPTALDPAAFTETPSGNRLGRIEPILPKTQPETEQVLGFTVRRDRTCSVEVHHVVEAESGRITEALVCAPVNPPQPDPYQTWDEETLAGMAYSDAHAAEVLGLRHVVSTDPNREALGLALLYRAAALSGDIATFEKAVAQRYAYMTRNGEPQIHNLKQLLVFHRIGAMLKDHRARPSVIHQALSEAQVSSEEINAIYRQVDQILESMAAIQTEATGDLTIREAIDNA
jgi:hypothetical protein